MCRILVMVIQFFRGIADHVLEFIFGIYWDRQREPVPDLDRHHECLRESATSLARKIKNKELKSEDLVRAAIERIKQVNPILNAVIDERYEAALAEAREIDERLDMGITDYCDKPFLGVPFTTKEASPVKGMSLTFGLWSRRNMRASEDSKAVARLRAAGAIPLALTNIPELLIWNETRNPVYGTTKNPHHTGRSPGGSSGGEAALMATYATPISLCSDVAGSTRIPSFNCGLFGYHPTAGATNLRGLFYRKGDEGNTMFCLGFISKTMEDMAPLMKVVAGDKQNLLNLDRQVDLKGVKIFYVEEFGDFWISPVRSDLKNAMKDVILNMEKRWPTENSPETYYHEGFNHSVNLWRYWMEKEPEDYFSLYNNGDGKPFIAFELVKKLLGFSRHNLNLIIRLAGLRFWPSPNPEWAETLTRELKNDISKTLGDNGVLLLPSGPIPCPYHYFPYTGPYNFGYWSIVNVLKCPAVQVPLGVNSKGLPLGIQVMAAPGNDALCIEVAKYLEQEFGGAIMACKAK
ncbi:hypothetical protein ABMA27_004742 [Loxostege sticticalis]|uniref:Amidase domain-containing protein n=1 Tax=Loxostege sticticalis TaxID=481309 RepID=A0ABR3HKI1_LOXSC